MARRSLTPVSSPPGERENHPLSAAAAPLEPDDVGLDAFGNLKSTSAPAAAAAGDRDECERAAGGGSKKSADLFQLRPLRTAFKSNLTASLRALRSVTRSISAINFTSLPPDDPAQRGRC